MALRSLDNALPTTPERPKKVAKIVGPLKSPTLDSSVNDENLAPTANVDPGAEYIASEDLQALLDPDTKMKDLLERLNSSNWMKASEALNDTRRLALHHSSFLLPTLDKVMLVMVKAMKSPRSALIKTSIMASADIFQAFGNVLLSSSSSEAFDHLLLQLLLKASQDKKFVCEEAERTLQKMTSLLAPLPLLHKLQACVSHTNPKVRAKAAISISNCICKLATNEMKEFGFVPLIQIAADLLNDRLPEAREAARSIANSVYKVFSGDDEHKVTGLSSLESWQSLCSSGLPPISAQAMAKIVRQ